MKASAALIAVVAVTAVTASAIGDIEFDSSIEAWFLDDDPDLLAYRRFL
jgi:hypothetical protein